LPPCLRISKTPSTMLSDSARGIRPSGYFIMMTFRIGTTQILTPVKEINMRTFYASQVSIFGQANRAQTNIFQPRAQSRLNSYLNRRLHRETRIREDCSSSLCHRMAREQKLEWGQLHRALLLLL
jgi:hypothetical protein